MKKKTSDYYLNRIHQIDRILSPAVETLIGFAIKDAPMDDPLKPSAKKPVFFPPWVSEHAVVPVKRYLLTRVTCSSTLLRVLRVRRRFPQLGDSLGKLGNWKRVIEETFLPKDHDNFEQCLFHLRSDTFGPLNPFTASAVFSILVDTGERLAHSGLGLLACFTMLWSLHRKFPHNHESGAQMDPWGPSAFITAKCLLPFHSLQKLSFCRAKSIQQTQEVLSKLMDLINLCGKNNPDPYVRWKFTSSLDDLSNVLSAASKIAIDRQALNRCSDEVSNLADNWDGTSPQDKLDEIVTKLNTALTKLIDKRSMFAKQAKTMLDEVDNEIVNQLKQDCARRIWRRQSKGPARRWRVPDEWRSNKDYWTDLKQAADLALKDCRKALDFIGLGDIPDRGPTFDGVQQRLTELKSNHEQLAKLFDEELRKYARGCLRVAEREIAYTSARNETAFDPSELVHAIMVAVQWDEMRSTLEIQDALKKALAGKREDGSWSPGQPFYMFGRTLAVVPTTSDIVWPLATAVMEKPEITVADDAFEHYVDWLERTQLTIPGARSPFHDKGMTGWVSERARGLRRIDLWATALAINGLLQIRDIFEERLWQLCQERYTVLVADKGLNEIDPVDLGLPHTHRRLHHKLSRIFRSIQDDDKHKEAAYIFVLHGPPGSSKTSIAKALAAEIWQSPGAEETHKPRFVRITPADFTRQGESHLDAEARSIFELLQGIRRVTIFFDEIDDLLHRRDPAESMTFMKLVVPAMLNRLQDLRDACPRQEVCVVFATNYIDQIESALLRKGRVDECIPLVYQDWGSRCMTVWRNIHKHGISKNRAMAKILSRDGTLLDRVVERIVRETNEQPWKLLDDVCKCICLKWKAVLEKGASAAELENSIEECIADYRFFLRKHEYDETRNFRCREFQQEILSHYLHSLPLDATKQQYLLCLEERLGQKEFFGRIQPVWDLKAEANEFWERKMAVKLGTLR